MKTLLCALVVAVTLVATAQSASPPIFPVQRPDRLCGPVCLIYCEYGNVLDALGCPTCQCNEPPKPVCSGLRLCKMLCPYGNVKDSNGCDLCRCKPRPRPVDVCPQVRCARPCPNGFRTTDKGCQTCQCKPTLCRPLCRMFCPHGNKKDEQGCPLCQCNPAPTPVCGLRLCKIRCPFGNVKDSNGCDLCRCKPRPQPIGCRLGNGTVLADKRPRDSFQLDACTTCRCSSRGDVTCAAVACGIPICDTDSPPVVVTGQCCPSCPQVPVKPVCGPLCRMGCPNGFVKGPDGCPICKCKPVTVPTSCRRQCRVYCAVASLGRTFGRQRRRNEPTGCDCNCPVRPIRPRYSTRN